jgi:hypothetical protein
MRVAAMTLLSLLCLSSVARACGEGFGNQRDSKGACPAPAKGGSKNGQSKDAAFSASRVKKEWERFTREPHPMGTAAQKAYADHLLKAFSSAGLDAKFHAFEVDAPHRANAKLAAEGKSVPSAAPRTVKESGRNVVATRRGSDACALLLGGHYDTKHYDEFRFVGANDGGSSTVLLLELARVLGKRTVPKGSYGACDVHFVLFDGEEAFLRDWNDGERLAGVKDHLYGSRAFAETQLTVLPGVKDAAGRPRLAYGGKPVTLLVLFDMVGHAKQKLFLTQGSHPEASSQLVAKRGAVSMSVVPLGIEDDHIPFAQRGVPFVHVIDWTNLEEWHTPKDTMDIVSPAKVVALAEVVRDFLAAPRRTP